MTIEFLTQILAGMMAIQILWHLTGFVSRALRSLWFSASVLGNRFLI